MEAAGRPKTNNRPFYVRVVEVPSTPLPSDPMVASSGLPAPLANRIAASLCSMHLDEHSAKVLHSFGVLRFAPVADEEYAGERAALRSWQGEQQSVAYQSGCVQAAS